MSGWLLFFVFVALVAHPSCDVPDRGWLVVPFVSMAWACVVLGLVAAALRTGGFL